MLLSPPHQSIWKKYQSSQQFYMELQLDIEKKHNTFTLLLLSSLFFVFYVVIENRFHFDGSSFI